MVDIVLPALGVVLVVVVVVLVVVVVEFPVVDDRDEEAARVGAEEEKVVEVPDKAGVGATPFANFGEGLEERGGAVGAVAVVVVELVGLTGEVVAEGPGNNALEGVLEELEGFGIMDGFGTLAALNFGGLSGCPLSIASCCLA